MEKLVITLIMIERIAVAVIGLLAAIYGQTWWSIFMGTILFILIVNTNIRVKGE